MGLRKRAWAARANIDVGCRSIDAIVLGSFLLQLVGVLARDPTLLDLVNVSLLLGLSRFRLLAGSDALVARNDDPLQGDFQIFLAVLLVVVLNLLISGM